MPGCRSDASGVYARFLPAATYTLKAVGETASGVPLYGTATEVVVAVGHTVVVDIVVTERPDLLEELSGPQPENPPWPWAPPEPPAIS